MTELEMAQSVSHILADKDFVFLDRETYIECVKVSLWEYSSYYPKRTSDVITINTSTNPDYNLSNLSSWMPDFSQVVGIELVEIGHMSETFLRGSYVKPNYYDVFEDRQNSIYILRFLFRYNGKLRIYYTVPYINLSEVPDIDLPGIKYLAAYYACLSASSKASQLVENYIGAEKMMFDRRAKNFMELAEKYKQQAYSLLNIPSDGTYPYSSTIAIPYIERRRAIRRTI